MAGAARRVVHAAASGSWTNLLDSDLNLDTARKLSLEGLSGWVAARIDETDAPASIQESALAGMLRKHRRRLAAQEIAWEQALLALRQPFDGIWALVFKGAHLAQDVYPTPAIRPRSDIDLIIEPSDREEVRSRLREHGFERITSIDAPALSVEECFVGNGPGGAPIALDVHIAFSNRPVLREALTIARLRSGAERGRQALAPFHTPGLVDALQIAALHRLGHRRSERRWGWLLDLQYLWLALDSRQRERLVASALERRVGAACADGLREARTLFGTAVDDRVLVELSSHASRELSSRLIDLPDTELAHFLFDLRCQSGGGKRLAMLFQHAFPDRTYMREAFGRRPDGSRRTLAGAYASRLYAGVRKRLSRRA